MRSSLRYAVATSAQSGVRRTTIATISISSFQPASSLTPEQCERHYVERHTVWARHMLRAHGGFRSYYTARALARLGSGGFVEPATRWRYVLLHPHDGVVARFDASVEDEIAEDHRNFLQDWRGFRADEAVVIDCRRGQLTCEAYLLEFDASGDEAAEAEAALSAAATALSASGSVAYGFRLFTIAHVVAAYAGTPIDLPGQRPDRRPIKDSPTLAIAMILFDQHEWAQDWFTSAAVRDALTSPHFSVVTHHVDLVCGFDES